MVLIQAYIPRLLLQSLVINVEYNQLDPLLSSQGDCKGDVADASTGYSPFPGKNLSIHDLHLVSHKFQKHISSMQHCIQKVMRIIL